jgi:hypothetical protein
MSQHEWIKEFPANVIVCDADGIILELNDRAAAAYEKDGGLALIGKKLLDCHSEASRGKLQQMLSAHEKNVYTIEKNGVKKLIFQSPWYKNGGKYAGFVEISLELPLEMPHFVRT